MGVNRSYLDEADVIFSDCETCEDRRVFRNARNRTFFGERGFSHGGIVHVQNVCLNGGWTFEQGLWRCPTCTEGKR